LEQIHKIELNKVNKENEKLKAELEWLAGVNNEFGVQNENLLAEIERYKRYRFPASARSSPEPGSEIEIESLSSKRPRTRSSSRSFRSKKSRKTDKGKSKMSETEAGSSDSEYEMDEMNEKEARVCNLIKIHNAILDYYFFHLILI
jgi:hypothetical protein